MDSQWYKIVIDTRKDVGKLKRVHSLFALLFEAAGSPSDAGLYARGIRGQHSVDVFFSPGAYRLAAGLAEANGAVRCEKPPKKGTNVLVHNAADSTPLD